MTLPPARWSATVPALPAGASSTGNSSLTSVACETRAYCVAVGSFTNAHGRPESMIDTAKDGKWTSMAAPLPAEHSLTSRHQPACGLSRRSALITIVATAMIYVWR